MWPRPADVPAAAPGDPIAVESLGVRALGLIPAFNEATNLEAVIHELRAHHPHLDLLVIDDGSTDETETVLRQIGVRWLRLPQRLGIGSAMRAGLRYADRLGYDVAIRIDGDGQHRAGDVARLLAPLAADRVDVIIGSRFRSQAASASPAAARAGADAVVDDRRASERPDVGVLRDRPTRPAGCWPTTTPPDIPNPSFVCFSPGTSCASPRSRSRRARGWAVRPR